MRAANGVAPATGLAARYARGLQEAIGQLRDRYPTHQLCLSVSGGRKGMAALAYYAAQRQRLGTVWHSLINEQEVEDRVSRTSEGLRRLSPERQARHLFLGDYDDAAFTLFPMPVIAMV